MTVDQEVCLGQAEGLLPKTVATWKSEECMCLVRCHVSGKKKKIPTMPPSMPWMHPCVWLLDCIIPPMAVLSGRIPFNLSAERTDGMLNCILFDSVHCVFILFHQELQTRPLIHSSKMPPTLPHHHIPFLAMCYRGETGLCGFHAWFLRGPVGMDDPTLRC